MAANHADASHWSIQHQGSILKLTNHLSLAILSFQLTLLQASNCHHQTIATQHPPRCLPWSSPFAPNGLPN
ncbi:hypothetical protein F5Y03DRAFT_129798 [Xylaria venustula]|nr:hypothetical protein F5Y03DRAFT_129798 [Xylaria venustula]